MRGDSSTVAHDEAFQRLRPHLEGLESADMTKILAENVSVVLILDTDGHIDHVYAQLSDLEASPCAAWKGKNWADVVAPDSSGKVAATFAELLEGLPTKRREINHVLGENVMLPLSITAVRPGPGQPVLILGRDMREIANLQQSLVSAQMGYEREFNRLRYAEMRYRLLFQVTAEAVLVVESESERIIDANPSAKAVLNGLLDSRGNGRALSALIDESSHGEVQALLASVKSTGTHATASVKLATSDNDAVDLAVSMFREGRKLYYLLRIGSETSPYLSATESALRGNELLLLSQLPDAFVVIDSEKRIASANVAFLNFCEAAAESQVIGQRIDNFVGRPGIDIGVLMKNLRDYDVVPRFSTICRGMLGGSLEVEISAVSAVENDQIWYGLAIREVARRAPVAGNDNRSSLPDTDNFAELVGRVPLKDLVRESTDLIEKRCIETALDITRGNRASAAEMLGLSRQSLYVKLRRYDLGGTDEDGKGALGPDNEN